MGLEEEIRKLPPERQAQVVDFIEFLLKREAEISPKEKSIQHFLEDFAKKPRLGRPKDELDRELLEERNAWDTGK